MALDLLIKNGWVVDGSGRPRYRADVGVSGGRIAAIGRIRESAREVLDAEGQVVSPGFVDGHTHMDAQIFWDPLGTSSCWHGITSVVMGNCGFTLAPCAKEDRHLVIRNLQRAEDIAAEAMGVNNALYKSVTFGVSAAYTGIAGALSAIVVAYVAPDSFDVFLSITLLTGIVIGGFGTIAGPIYGALFIQFVPNWAQDISKAAPWAIFGAFLIGFMYVMPRGIAGFLQILWIRLTRPAVSKGEGR